MSRRKMPYYISKMLSTRIEEMEKRYTDKPSTSKQPELSLCRIKKCTRKTTETLEQLQEYEDLLLQMCESLDKELDHGVLEKTMEKIEAIYKAGKKFKRRMSPYLSKEVKKASVLPPQQSSSNVEAPKMSEYLDLGIEENLKDSPVESNLQVSFEFLPVNLRLCMLTLAVFPEKQLIKKKPLLYWWIGEGFITKSNDKTAEKVGEEAIDQLIELGLIQPRYKTTKSPIISCFTLNPWFHRKLRLIARQANFIDLDEIKKTSRFILDQRSSSNDNHPKGKLLAMINVSEKYPNFREDIFTKFGKFMKVVQLGRWQSSPRHHIEIEGGKFLNKLYIQKQLKYLSLRGISRIITLPSSIVGCQNLEILDLRACHSLESLPFDIGSFEKITHFDVSECYVLQNLPKGLETLASLEVLKGFVVNHWRINYCTVSALCKFEKLRKLSITVGMVRKVFEVGETLSMKNLQILTITWHSSSSSESMSEDEKKERYSDPFANIKLPSLEKLDLRGFPFGTLPPWVCPEHLENLKRLYISGGNLETLLPLSIPWKVEILRMNYLKNFQFRIQASFDVQKHFPHLFYFERIKADGTEEAYFEWGKDDGWQILENELRPPQVMIPGREKISHQMIPGAVLEMEGEEVLTRYGELS